MATIKQIKAINNLVENHGNVSKAMRDAGYDATTAKNPKNLTNSKTFQEKCEECGLTDDFLLKALKEDIELKPQDRKGELELGFKVKGKMKDADSGIGNLNIFFDQAFEKRGKK